MGQATDQIENHIENKREDLKSNLQELETRVKSATDWRHYFDQNPGMMLAAAFGGGLLLSTMIGKRRSAGSPPSSPAATDTPHAASQTKHEVLEKWDAIKSALVGVAATKFKGMLGEVVPGFQEHLVQAEGERGRDSTH